jgi:hypothetical protein
MQNPNGLTVNPQATDNELAWLAGFYDGEGTFQVVRWKQKNDKWGQHAAIEVTNTDPTLVAKVYEILDKMGCVPHVCNSKPSNANHKEHWVVSVTKLTHIKLACELLLPFLVGKKSRAELLLRYANSRLKYQKENGTGRHAPYTDSELEIVGQLKTLNRRGASTTARATAEKQKIQSELHGDMQRVAEMTIPRGGESVTL